MEFTDEIRGIRNALTIEIGEGRVLDPALLEKIKEIALSPMIPYSLGEKEFF